MSRPLPIAMVIPVTIQLGYRAFLRSGHTGTLSTFTLRLVLIALVPMSAAAQTAPNRCSIGAIRWDAWVGDHSPVGQTVENTLSPRRWHYRLPFYAREISDTSVQVRADSQAVMDREIAYAKGAGLDYWAFVLYDSEDPMTIGGLNLYLASSHDHDLRFCAILEGSRWVGTRETLEKIRTRLIEYFKSPSYQTVCGRRPLLYVLQSGSVVRQTVDTLRKTSLAAGFGDPYIVAMDWSPEKVKAAVDNLGLDAVSSYASNGGQTAGHYSDLTAYTQWNWDAYAKTNSAVVPWVTTGWDRRPRVENPVFWETPTTDTAYYDTAKPTEIAHHLKAAIDWNTNNPAKSPAKTVIIYAWNELDEGGWLLPTLQDNTARLDAVRDVLNGGK